MSKEHVLFNFIKETLKKKQLNARSPFYQVFCFHFEQKQDENTESLVRVLSYLSYTDLLGLRLVSQKFDETITSPYFYHCLATIANQE